MNRYQDPGEQTSGRARESAPSCPETLDIFAGEEKKEAAIKRVGENADPMWFIVALAAVLECAQTAEEFTTDRVWALLARRGVRDTAEPRAMGAVMRQAATDGLIVATDRTRKSARPDCHRRPVRVWRSRVYKAEAA